MNTTPNNTLLNTTEETVTYYFTSIVLPILAVIGIFGNLAIVPSLSNINQQHCTASFAKLICSANVLVLLLDPGLDAISKLTKTKHLTQMYEWTCKLHTVMDQTFLHWTAWCTVLMGGERAVFLFKTSFICSPFKAKCLATAAFIGVLSIDVHAMWSHTIDKIWGCYFDLVYPDFHTLYWPYVIASINTYAPILFGIGIAIAVTLGIT